MMVDDGVLYGLWYLMFGVIFCYSVLFLWIELYGIIYNLSYNEIFNRHSYKYLFDLFIDGRGAIMNIFKNPGDRGIINNIKNYVIRSIS